MDTQLFNTKDQIERLWNMVFQLTNRGDGVHITVPHDPCRHRFNGELYQVRVWGPGSRNTSKRGHISGDVDHLFEVFISSPLTEAGPSGWYRELSELGISLMGGNWVKETLTAYDESRFDVIRKEEVRISVK